MLWTFYDTKELKLLVPGLDEYRWTWPSKRWKNSHRIGQQPCWRSLYSNVILVNRVAEVPANTDHCLEVVQVALQLPIKGDQWIQKIQCENLISHHELELLAIVFKE